MRTQTIATVEAVYNTSIECYISVTGKCFLDSLYSPAHPIQTKRAQNNVGNTGRRNCQLYAYVRRRCRYVVWIRQKPRFVK